MQTYLKNQIPPGKEATDPRMAKRAEPVFDPQDLSHVSADVLLII